MGHYVDILTPNEARPSLEDVTRKAKQYLPECEVVVNLGTEAEWEELIVWFAEDDPVCTIGFSPFTKADPEDSDLAWVLSDIEGCEPKTGVHWLREYVPKINTMVRIRFLHRAFEGTDNGLTSAMIEWLHEQCGGIIRSDYEGYSNENGHHIVWQFDDSATGPWESAVRRADGTWDAFIMDLGNGDHRAAFKRGQVPEGAERFSGRRPDSAQ